MNRSRRSVKSITTICLEPLQFSCWNENDPNHPALVELADQYMKDITVPNNIALMTCWWVAKGLILDYIKDNTNGALNYVTEQLYVSQNAPTWAREMKNLVRIGSQIFGVA